MYSKNEFVNLSKTLLNVVSGKSFSKNVGVNVRNLLLYLVPGKRILRVKCFMCGYPRSGTHWIRNVVENSSGQKTFNLYEELPLLGIENALVVKIHARDKRIANIKARLNLPPFQFAGKYIYAYRDPRDTIISLFEMYKVSKETPNLNPASFIDFYDPIRQYRWEINSWVLANHDDVLLVKYESLKLNPIDNFEKIFTYLDLKNPVHVDSIDQKVATMDKIDRPRGTVYGWKNSYNKYKELVDTVNDQLECEIKMLGYDF